MPNFLVRYFPGGATEVLICAYFFAIFGYFAGKSYINSISRQKHKINISNPLNQIYTK